MSPYLDGLNYKTFAISFNNGAADNYSWAEVICDAVQRIKAVTGAAKVDIVSWSKGTIASRMYVSRLKQSWGTAYVGDVRKLILVGGMGGGWDWTFRHGRDTSYLIYPECSGGTFQPLGGSAHTGRWCGGAVNDVHPELTLYNVSGYGDPVVGIARCCESSSAAIRSAPNSTPGAPTTADGATRTAATATASTTPSRSRPDR